MLRYLLGKEFKLLWRTPLLRYMNIFYPIVILLMLPWATNMDINSLKTIILDEDHSTLSEELSRHFTRSGYFITNESVASYSQAQEAMYANRADVIITIPKGFEKALYRSEQTDISVVVNAINATKGALADSYSGQIVSSFVRNFREQLLIGTVEEQFVNPVHFSEVSLYNPSHNYRSFVIPGLITMIFTLTALIMPAVGLVQEKEFGTIEQLNVTPVKGYQVILSKSIPYWCVNMVMVPVSILLVGLVYNIWPSGSIPGILLATLLFSIGQTGLGLLLGNYSDRLQQLMFSAIFLMMISLLMSGLFTPIGGMPLWAKCVAYAQPLTYFIRDMRSLFLRGSSIADLWRDYVILSAFAVGLFSVGFLTYHKRV